MEINPTLCKYKIRKNKMFRRYIYLYMNNISLLNVSVFLNHLQGDVSR